MRGACAPRNAHEPLFVSHLKRLPGSALMGRGGRATGVRFVTSTVDPFFMVEFLCAFPALESTFSCLRLLGFVFVVVGTSIVPMRAVHGAVHFSMWVSPLPCRVSSLARTEESCSSIFQFCHCHVQRKSQVPGISKVEVGLQYIKH